MFYYDNDIANQKHANITDISALLTYVMDVFGEATFRCKMSAVTIKEGPATQYSSSVIPVYGKDNNLYYKGPVFRPGEK